MKEVQIKEYHCEDCGKVTERYWLVCPECRTKRIFNKAEKMTYKQYCEKYPDYPILI